DNTDPGHALWLERSRRPSQERRSVPGASTPVANQSGSLFRLPVSQGSTETELCDRKNKRQPFPNLCAARFPPPRRPQPVRPNRRWAPLSSTSRRTGKPRDSGRVHVQARPLPELVAGLSARALRCSNVPFELLLKWVCRLLSP